MRVGIPPPPGAPFPDMNQFAVSGRRRRAEAVTEKQPRKTSGPDMILARQLKECAEDIAPILAINIFNRSLNSYRRQETADVSAVFKKDQRYVPAKYRPGLEVIT